MVEAQRKKANMTLSTEDRLDVLDLIARADNAATARDAVMYVSLFTDDAVLDGAEGVHRGKDALLKAVGPVWAAEGPKSVHLTLNAVIEPVSGRLDEAVATSKLVIVAPGSSFEVRTVATIVQHVVRVDGTWRISRRSVSSEDAKD